VEPEEPVVTPPSHSPDQAPLDVPTARLVRYGLAFETNGKSLVIAIECGLGIAESFIVRVTRLTIGEGGVIMAGLLVA